MFIRYINKTVNNIRKEKEMDDKYILTDGSNYLAIVKTGLTVVGNINKAQQFTRIKAENQLKSLPATFRRFKFKIQKYNVEESEVKPIERDEFFDKMVAEDKKYDGLMDNIYDKILNFEQYIKQLKEYDKYIDVQLEVLKRALRDTEHKFELENLDMYSSWKIGKDIQSIQKRRRKLKNDQEMIKYMMERNFMDCTMNMISSYIESKQTEEPTYMSRYLEYLFEK